MAFKNENQTKLIQKLQKNESAWQFLNENYSDSVGTIERYTHLLEIFNAEFGSYPQTVLRAPGRVNLLGGHTDYNGCPVIPIATDRDIAGALSVRQDAKVVLISTNPRFEKRSFYIEQNIEPFQTGDWANYVKAAVQGLVTYFKQQRGLSLTNGFNMAVSGTVPPAAGMASSSALVVLSAIAFLYANSLEMDRLELAQLLAKAEWYVGTQGGGMDQAISLMGRANHGLKIEFNPYSTLPVPLPDGYVIFVTHSLVYAPKTESAMEKYNRRPIECRLAVALIKKHLQVKLGRSFDNVRLIGDLTKAKLGLTDENIYQLCLDALPENIYTYSAISGILGQSISEIQKQHCLKRDGSVFNEPGDGFKLRSRFIHIFTEWKRVIKAIDILNNGEMLQFGNLMNEAQISCRENYEISVPEIDKLIELSLANGAIGARLTGAGFGGCVVHLVPEDKATRFQEQLVSEYYQTYAKGLMPAEQSWRDFLFICKSADGAGEAAFCKYLTK